MEETGKKLQSSFLFMSAENSSRRFCSFAKSQEPFENLAGHRTTHWTLLCGPHHVLGASFTRTPMPTRREHEMPWRIQAHAALVCSCLHTIFLLLFHKGCPVLLSLLLLSLLLLLLLGLLLLTAEPSPPHRLPLSPSSSSSCI